MWVRPKPDWWVACLYTHVHTCRFGPFGSLTLRMMGDYPDMTELQFSTGPPKTVEGALSENS